jgi:hypothetical protein
MTEFNLVAELARDGVWTAKQLRERLSRWRIDVPEGCIRRRLVPLRPTAWARRTVDAEVVEPTARGIELARMLGVPLQTIRPGELEHALGLAELRWRCGIPAQRYTPQNVVGRTHRRLATADGAGLAAALWDGTYEVPGGVVLCEYDHGRYTGRQVREKLSVFRQAIHVGGKRILGTVWGVPTERRAAWLRSLGVSDFIVLEPSTWLV